MQRSKTVIYWSIVAGIAVGTPLGFLASVYLKTEDFDKWMTVWGGFVGSVLGAIATIAAGVFAWLSATASTRQAKYFARERLLGVFHNVSYCWKQLSEIEQFPEKRFNYFQTTLKVALASSALDRLEKASHGLSPADRAVYGEYIDDLRALRDLCKPIIANDSKFPNTHRDPILFRKIHASLSILTVKIRKSDATLLHKFKGCPMKEIDQMDEDQKIFVVYDFMTK